MPGGVYYYRVYPFSGCRGREMQEMMHRRKLKEFVQLGDEKQ